MIMHRTFQITESVFKEQARTLEPLSFQALLEELIPHAQSKGFCIFFRFMGWIWFLIPASMPLAVKREVMAIIRQYLEKQFETWLLFRAMMCS